MYVTDLEISDLRSFRGTQNVSLDRGDGTYAGWTVFAGRNALAALDVKVIDGTAVPEEIDRYQDLKQQLPESMDELADQSVRALLARGAHP